MGGIVSNKTFVMDRDKLTGWKQYVSPSKSSCTYLSEAELLRRLMAW
jgi:hypothetical protein